MNMCRLFALDQTIAQFWLRTILLVAYLCVVVSYEAGAADLTKGKYFQTASVIDKIFGAPDDCKPKKYFWYDKNNRSIYGDKVGFLEEFGAKSHEEIVGPNDDFIQPIKILHFSINSKPRFTHEVQLPLTC